MSEEVKNDVVVVDGVAPAVVATATPETEKKRRNRKPGSKGKPKAPKLVAPEGGWKSVEDANANFKFGVHAKLKEQDFADVLDHARWEVTYAERSLERAKQKVTRIESLGATPEERKASAQTAKLVEGMASLLQAGSLPASQLEMLQMLLATATAKAS